MQLLGRIANFDEPIDALEICHENIVKRMDTIASMAEGIRREKAGAFREQIDIWMEIFSFIRHNVGNHSRDEEENLFPILRRTMAEKIDALEADHEWAEETERFLQSEFDALRAMEKDEEMNERLEEFAGRAIALARFYRDHIAKENGEIFPEARKILSPEEIAELGASMKRRRNLTITIAATPPA